MKGDYCRYIAENVDGNTKKKYADQSLAPYNAALDAAKNMDYINPIKLGLVLNLSMPYYEVIGNKDEARKLAEDTLAKSKEALDDADEEKDEVKDLKLMISQLLPLNENMMWC